MSELLDIFRCDEEEILQALDKKLQVANCRKLMQARSGKSSAIIEAFRASCREDDQRGARNWAKALREEAVALGVPFSEVLEALNCLERAVRFHVVKALDKKTALLSALSELGKAVDSLRRCYVDVPVAVREVDAYEADDFVGLADGMEVFVCLTTLHGKPFYLNPAGCRLTGLEGDRPELASSLHDYYAHESWIELRDVAVPAVKASGRWEGRSRLRHVKTGELIEVQTSMLLVKRRHDDKPSCLAVIHRDGRDLEQLQETLDEAQARKHAILESALDPIITINHEGVVTEFNRAAEQTFGHSRADVLGTHPSEILFPPSKSAGEQDRIDRYLDAGEGSMLGRRIEVTAVRANGETFPAEMAMTISHEQGAPVLTFFVRDISQRKKAEREQVRYAAELERSNRELEQFAYVASHDLQEPLRKIRTFSDRLEMKSGEFLNETGQECIQRMQSAAARMQVLIEGLLTLSRITTRGKNFVPVDLAQVAREVVSDLEVQIEQVEGRVEVDKLPTIQADPLQMRQLLQNLIGNALKFHRHDEPPVVQIQGRFVGGRKRSEAGQPAADERCRIIVKDNGIGFEEKYLDRVFDIFQRLHLRDVYEGTGIGLAICRRIVERHGGSITARSTPGEGTAFEVLLPVVQPKRKGK